MKKVLMATLGGMHMAAVNAILDKNPDYLWIICTQQSENNIPNIQPALLEQNQSMPQLLGKTLTVHQDIKQIYSDVKRDLTKLLEQDYIVYLDLTSGTVPMSIAAWEVAREHSEVIVSWIDHQGGGQTYILQMA